MAQSERFYFWRGYYDALLKLPTAEQRDEFVMAICAYAFDGIEPDFGGDALLDVVWQIVRDQVAESVAIGRDMAERGRRSGEARRRKSGNSEHRSNTVPNTVPNEGKGTDRKGSDTSPYGEGGSAHAPDGAARAAGDGRTSTVNPDGTITLPDGAVIPPRPDGWCG